MKTHLPGYSLTQGLKGDATHLMVSQDGNIRDFGLNAVCTHLGCVVPWNKAENKFKCPCHGSQYNADGKVIRGPAPLSLRSLTSLSTTPTPWCSLSGLNRISELGKYLSIAKCSARHERENVTRWTM